MEFDTNTAMHLAAFNEHCKAHSVSLKGAH